MLNEIPAIIHVRYIIDYGGIVFANLCECIEDDHGVLCELGAPSPGVWDGTTVTYEVAFSDASDGWDAREQANETRARLVNGDSVKMEKVA